MLAPIAIDLTSHFVNKRDSPSQIKTRLEQWSPTRPGSIHDVENRLQVANERREEFLLCKQVAAKNADEKHQLVKAKLASQLEQDQDALGKRIEAMEARAVKNRQAYIARTLTELREKNKLKDKRDATKLHQNECRKEARERMLQKQAQAEARAQAARDRVQAKASRVASSVLERLTALKVAETTSTALTKELNHQRHAEAEARKVAALKQTIAKGVRMASPVKNRVELEVMEEAQRQQRRTQLEKRLAEAGARAEAIRQETARKAASMASPRRVKVSSARQADATPVATTEETIELSCGAGVVLDFASTVTSPQVSGASSSSKLNVSGEGDEKLIVGVPRAPGICREHENLLSASEGTTGCGEASQALTSLPAPPTQAEEQQPTLMGVTECHLKDNQEEETAAMEVTPGNSVREDDGHTNSGSTTAGNKGGVLCATQ